MKAFLLAIAVLALAACVGWSEPASTRCEPLSPREVQLVSEDLQPSALQAGQVRNSGKGHRGGYLTR